MFVKMAHLHKVTLQSGPVTLWSDCAVRDLDVVIHYLRQASHQRRCCAEYSASVLGALISYSRPFTERPHPAVNPPAHERRCFLSLAADLGADLRLHRILLQARDEVIALSELVHSPMARFRSRCFIHPDPRLSRIIRQLELDRFRALAGIMRVACRFFGAEMNFRRL
jgi:hypothetical protein